MAVAIPNDANDANDALTGLPGRPTIARALEGDARDFTVGAVLFVDLDRFKWINDSMGHHVGDEVLETVARRLTEVVRSFDVVARFGGDEFVVIMSPIKSVADTTRLARRVVESVSRTISIDGKDLAVGASVGIAVMSEGLDSGILLRQADLALYEAKRRGGGRHIIFDHRLASMAERRVQLERSIRNAIEGEWLTLHYQPIVTVDSRQVVGFEALARLTEPDMGPISPAEFIPLASEIGYMKTMGTYLRSRLMSDLAAALKMSPDVSFSFNLSPTELEDRGLAAAIGDECELYGVPPSSLTLELSEDMLVQDRRRLELTLGGLREMGCRISLDDFGTGRASLTSMKKLPVDEIKVDRSFVADVANNRFNQATCEAILLLADALNATVVAEGVESEEELEFLHKIGIHHCQGYYFAKPVAIDWSSDAPSFRPAQVL